MEGVALPELLVGFRFHPTDEELIIHYLQKKVSSSPLPASIIADIDPYDHDPWDLPAKAFSGENEWYFFSRKNPGYPNGAQPNRAAGAGYWKATGEDIPIVSASGSTSPEKVGVKKSLVFYKGKLHEGVMTNWVMNEYWLAQTLTDQPLDDWVLCRLFQKVNHFPGMVSCSELEVPSPSATDVQRTREKPATPRQMENLPSHATSDAEFGSFWRLVLNEGPSMENLPSHATSDANNAAVSSAESGSDSSMNWSAHSLQETSGRPMNIFDIFLIKIRREQRESNPGL